VLEAGAALLAHTLPGSDLPAPPAELLMNSSARCPVTPGSPAELLLSHIARADTTGQRHARGPLTAVILGMVVGAKLEAVVGPANQISLAAPVSVIVTAVTGSVTVTLALVTGGLGGAASLAVIIPSRASLTCGGFQGHTGRDQRQRLGGGQGLWKVTAVILLVKVCSELLAVVAAAHQVALTTAVTIVSSSVQRSVTVTLAVSAGGLWSAAPATIEVTPSTSLALRGLRQWGAGRTPLTKSQSCENC